MASLEQIFKCLSLSWWLVFSSLFQRDVRLSWGKRHEAEVRCSIPEHLGNCMQ